MAVKVTVYGTADMSQITRARAELDKLEAQANQNAGGFAGAMARIGASAKTAGDAMVSTGKSLTTGLTLPIVALGAGLYKATEGAAQDAAAQVTLATTLKNTAGATSDAVAQTEAWITKQGELLGVADDQLRPALGTLATATGSVTKAQELAATAMDIAAAKGIPVETAAKALAKAYDGNFGALTKLMPGIDQAAVKAKDFGAVMDSVSQIVGGQASNAAETQAGKMQRAKVAFAEATEQLGYAFMPILTQVTDFMSANVVPAITAVANWFGKLDEGTKTLIISVAGIAAALGPTLVVVGKITSGVGTAASAIGAMSRAVEASGAIQKIATAIQWAWNAALSANPIGIIIVAIAALVAALIWFFTQTDLGKQIWSGFVGWFQDSVKAVSEWWNSTWAAISQWFTDTWNGIQAAGQVVWDAMAAAIKFIWDGIKLYFTVLFTVYKTIFTTAFNAIKAVVETIFNGVKQVITTIWNGIQAFFKTGVALVQAIFRGDFGKVKEIMGDILRGIANLAKDIWKGIEDTFKNISKIGKDIVNGLWNGIKGGWDWLVNQVKDLASGLLDGVKSVLGIKSPSTEFAAIGEFMNAGLSQGLLRSIGQVRNAAQAVAGAAIVDATATVTGGGYGGGQALAAAPGNRSVTVAQGAIQITINGNADRQTVAAAGDDLIRKLVRELRAQ